MDNWRVVPSWLGTVVELPDHKARFTAGSFAGTGSILCDYQGQTYYMPVMVIANYQLNGHFFYKDSSSTLNLPIIGAEVMLFTANPLSNDLEVYIGNQWFHFQYVTSVYTDTAGYYQFNNLNADSIAVLVHMLSPSHGVGYVNNGYWYWWYWGYSWFGFESLMDWQTPVISRYYEPISGEYRGACNIMSFTNKGVNYVAGLPGSQFPERVVMWWDPNDPNNTGSWYMHDWITLNGQVYDFICVSGWRNYDEPDEWDKDVFLHEYGHFVMDNYSHLLLPGTVPNCNFHSWQGVSSEECAYTEGWATFFSCACQNDPTYWDTKRDGSTYIKENAEISSKNPQGGAVEGAVCASLWDVFDSANDWTVWYEGTLCQNDDENGGLWWQGINRIWWTTCEAACLGDFPFTVCEFNKTWAWKSYPRDEVWQDIFNAHGIGCAYTDVSNWSASVSSQKAFLWPNVPNPFNPQTSVDFRVPTPQTVRLRLFNASGQLVRTLVDSFLDSGTYTVCWDGKSNSGAPVSSGIYFCNLNIGAFDQARKFVLVR